MKCSLIMKKANILSVSQKHTLNVSFVPQEGKILNQVGKYFLITPPELSWNPPIFINVLRFLHPSIWQKVVHILFSFNLLFSLPVNFGLKLPFRMCKQKQINRQLLLDPL